MQVFKAFFKILKVHKTAVIIYAAIVVAMMLVMNATGAGEQDIFQQEGYTLLIQDEDESEISRGLSDYLSGIHEIKDGSFTDEQITDMLYYRSVLAYIIIPKGFSEDVKNGKVPTVTMRSDNALPVSSYLERQINAYVSHLAGYLVLGESFEKANEKALVDSDYARLVTIRTAEEGAGSDEIAFSVVMFSAFSIMGIIFSGLLPVLFRFKQPGVYERNMISSCRPEKRNLVLAIASVLFSVGVFVIISLVDIFAEGKNNSTETMALFIFNLFVFTVTVGLMATAVSNLPIAGTDGQVGMITNIISLSFAFLGGVFVPLSVLGEGVKNIARFLPTYWYATAVNRIRDGEGLADITDCLLIQLLFGVACMAVGLIVSRLWENKTLHKTKEKKPA